eukprot:3928588-Ditylum_brightwellii.AAC.1
MVTNRDIRAGPFPVVLCFTLNAVVNSLPVDILLDIFQISMVTLDWTYSAGSTLPIVVSKLIRAAR